MAQIDGAGQQDADNEDAEALQAALAQRQGTLPGQPQGGSDVPIHQNSDPVVRRIGNSTLPSASYRKTSCTVYGMRAGSSACSRICLVGLTARARAAEPGSSQCREPTAIRPEVSPLFLWAAP